VIALPASLRDDGRPLQRLAHPCRPRARHRVGGAAGGERNHPCHRLGRIHLRGRRRGQPSRAPDTHAAAQRRPWYNFEFIRIYFAGVEKWP